MALPNNIGGEKKSSEPLKDMKQWNEQEAEWPYKHQLGVERLSRWWIWLWGEVTDANNRCTVFKTTSVVY